MITCKTFEQAEKVAKEISAKELRSISIVQRGLRLANNNILINELNGLRIVPNRDFIVCNKGGNDRECHDIYTMLVTNFESPFEVKSISPKSGEHSDWFPTISSADTYYKELIEEKYRKSVQRMYV